MGESSNAGLGRRPQFAETSSGDDGAGRGRVDDEPEHPQFTGDSIDDGTGRRRVDDEPEHPLVRYPLSTASSRSLVRRSPHEAVAVLGEEQQGEVLVAVELLDAEQQGKALVAAVVVVLVEEALLLAVELAMVSTIRRTRMNIHKEQMVQVLLHAFFHCSHACYSTYKEYCLIGVVVEHVHMVMFFFNIIW